MKHRIIKRFLAALIAIVCVIIIYSSKYNEPTIASATTHTVPVQAYEPEGHDEDYTKNGPVDKMSYGKASLGSLSVDGNINTVSSIKDDNGKSYIAYGLQAGQLKLSYNYDGYLL